MKFAASILLLSAGAIGLRLSTDFTPSVLLLVLAASVAALAFKQARTRWHDNDKGYNPTTMGMLVAFAVFFVLLFPVGKAMTFAFGSKIELGGTVASYHRSPSVRRSWHGCRGKNLVSLSNGKTVEVCGMELPRGMPVRLSMMSSALGRYSEQLASQTDLAGIGSLDGIVGQADRATEEADRAVQAARRTIGE
jgi:hypothetical protein